MYYDKISHRFSDETVIINEKSNKWKSDSNKIIKIKVVIK